MNALPDMPVPAAAMPAGVHRRHQRVTAALVAAALLALGVGSARLVQRPDEPSPRVVATSSQATTSTSAASTSAASANAASAAAASAAASTPTVRAERLALTALLATRREAVLAGDRAAWLSTVDRQDRRFYAAQARAFDNMVDVPFSDWSYAYLGRGALPPGRVHAAGAGAWVARVLTGYRLRGQDSATSYVEQHLTVVRRGTRWLLCSTTDGSTAAQPWDLGRVHAVRGERVLVLGNAPRATLATYATAGDRAVARVSAVWGTSWGRRAVLVAPRTQHQFGQLLQRSDDGLSQVAAVTTGDLGRTDGTARGGSDRVVINPAAFARLDALGRRVVLTHEMAHVAVRQSTTSTVPIWLSEGFADFLGYRGTGVTRRDGAGDVLAQVRSGHGPRSLPGPQDFDPRRTSIAPSYSSSWLACSLIADQYGTDKLVELYRAAATAPATGDPAGDRQLHAAFPKVLGISEEAFTRQWREYLDRLAG